MRRYQINMTNLLFLLFLVPCVLLSGCAVTPVCVKQHRSEPYSDAPETVSTADPFGQALEQSVRETDAEFCKKATEEWQVQAFCHKETR